MMRVVRLIATPILHACFFIEVVGADRVPATGPVILAPNHTSYLDPFAVTYPMRRPVYYLAWHKLFQVPLLRWLIPRLGAIPVDTDKRTDRTAYASALSLLGQGKLLCVFPEGIRGWDGKPNALQSGVGRLAASSGATVVPVWIDGAIAAWPRWRLLPRPFIPVRVRFLEPIVPTTDRAHARDEAERIRSAILNAYWSASTP
jgi:1-acyl-sn-glycerol-3-phosphate acyltransferase